MASDPRSIEIADIDDLGALIDDVRRSRRPRILRRDGEDIAVLAPVPSEEKLSTRASRLRAPTADEVDRSRRGIEAAAGSWADVDADALKAELRRQRDVSTRPPISL